MFGGHSKKVWNWERRSSQPEGWEIVGPGSPVHSPARPAGSPGVGSGVHEGEGRGDVGSNGNMGWKRKLSVWEVDFASLGRRSNKKEIMHRKISRVMRRGC